MSVCSVCLCVPVCMFGSEASHTRTRLQLHPHGPSLWSLTWVGEVVQGMSQSRELMPTSVQVHLGGTGRSWAAHLPAHRMPSLGDLGEEMGLCIIKTGRAEDPVLAVQSRVSEKPECTCRLLSGVEVAEAGSTLETDKKLRSEEEISVKDIRETTNKKVGERERTQEVK